MATRITIPKRSPKFFRCLIVDTVASGALCSNLRREAWPGPAPTSKSLHESQMTHSSLFVLSPRETQYAFAKNPQKTVQ